VAGERTVVGLRYRKEWQTSTYRSATAKKQ